MYFCVPHAYISHGDQKRASDPLSQELNGCELPSRCWHLILDPLDEWYS